MFRRHGSAVCDRNCVHLFGKVVEAIDIGVWIVEGSVVAAIVGTIVVGTIVVDTAVIISTIGVATGSASARTTRTTIVGTNVGPVVGRIVVVGNTCCGSITIMLCHPHCIPGTLWSAMPGNNATDTLRHLLSE